MIINIALYLNITEFQKQKYHWRLNVTGSRSLSGSLTGGTKDTQDMIEFCAANKIYPEIEIINIQYINEALERLIKKDVRYRFVIDIKNSLK